MQAWGDRVLNSLVSVAISGVVAGFFALIVAWVNDVGAMVTVGIVLAVTGAVFLLGTALVLWYRNTQQTYVSYPHPGFDLRILEKRIIYRVDDDGVLHFSRRLKVKALKNNVDRYIDKYVWTGGGSALPTPGVGVDEIRPRGTAGIWTFYDSSFIQNLRRGETLEISANWPELDASKSRPFVSTASDEPTSRIVFELSIPAKFRRDDNAKLEEMRSIESIFPFKTEDGSFNDKGDLTWEIKPGHYRHYRIRWGWSEGSAVQSMDEVAAVEAK